MNAVLQNRITGDVISFDIKEVKKQLRKNQVIICMTPMVYAAYASVYMQMNFDSVKAKIEKGF